MESKKRTSIGKGKKLLAVMLSAMLIGTTAITVGSYTGTSITASAATDTEETSSSDFEYTTNDDGTLTITGYRGKYGNITIPSEIDGKTVTKIVGRNLFMVREGDSINIPASITEIQPNAFAQYESNKLKNINVDKDNPAYSSKDGVLFSKDGTKLLVYPQNRELTSSEMESLLQNVKEIGDYAFFMCYNFDLTDSTLIIPDSVEVIGEYAFSGIVNGHIKNLKLGKNVKSIGYKAFFSNRGVPINEVTFPENIEFIGSGAFETSFLDYTKENTTFKGYAGSYAELYCKAYGYKFESLGTAAEKPELTNDEFGIKVKGSFPDGATLSVEKATSKLIPDAVFCYNISLNKDNKAVQPTGFVTVSIPCDVENCTVYYEDVENNTLTDMNAIYLDGCYIFSTNHFSDYMIVPNGTEINVDVIQPSFEPTNSTVTPENPNNNNNDNNNDNNNSENNNTNNDTDNNTNNNDVPATGDNSFAMVAMIAAAVSAVTMLFARNRKKKAE